MTKTYKGYNLFNDIDNVGLRTWNRCATAFNIYQDKGEELFEQYVTQFKEKDQQMIKLTFQYLVLKREQYGAKEGYEMVKRELCKDVQATLEA